MGGCLKIRLVNIKCADSALFILLESQAKKVKTNKMLMYLALIP